MTRNVGIYLFDEVEALDFAGPFEVFTTASRLKQRLRPDAPPAFLVFTIGDKIRGIRARAGLVLQPHFDFASHPHVDVLIIPGGIVEAERSRSEVIQWIASQADGAEITASVCTGSFLLAQAGLLEGKRATTHFEDLLDLRLGFPGIEVIPGVRWVDNGSLLTSAGISAGIEMSLHLVARLEGDDLAQRTARQMEYFPSTAAQRQRAAMRPLTGMPMDLAMQRPLLD